MALTGDALFVYLMRVDRGHEVSDRVASGARPIMYDRMRQSAHCERLRYEARNGSRPWVEMRAVRR